MKAFICKFGDIFVLFIYKTNTRAELVNPLPGVAVDSGGGGPRALAPLYDSFTLCNEQATKGCLKVQRSTDTDWPVSDIFLFYVSSHF